MARNIFGQRSVGHGGGAPLFGSAGPCIGSRPVSFQKGYNLRVRSKGSRASDGNFFLCTTKAFVNIIRGLGWRFCLIDRYSLTREGAERLVGSYVSHACQDDAQVDLNRVGSSN